MNEHQTSTAQKAETLRPYKRRVRNILIHKPMQREFTFVIMTLLVVSSLAITFVIHYTLRAAAQGGGFRFGAVSPYEILSDVSYQLIVRVAIILFVTLIVTGAFGILFLHRVAGPVYRFRQIFMRINRGEIPAEIRIRHGDYFEEIVTEINELIRRLRFEKEKSETLKNKADEILASQPPEAVAKSVKTIKETIESPYPERS